MKTPRTQKGFTLIELLVVIGIIALLASIAVPAFVGVQVKAAQTKALSNAKQIGLACATFAIDNNGQYPNYQASSTGTGTTTATYAYQVFNNLFPIYLTTVQVFYQAKSQNTPNPMTDPTTASMQAGTALTTGNNEWSYVTGLYNTSSSTLPLIASGFNAVAPGSCTYSNNENARGGVWKGANAVVVFCDTSARVMKCNSSYEVIGSVTADEFDTTGGGTTPWLTSANTVLMPW